MRTQYWHRNEGFHPTDLGSTVKLWLKGSLGVYKDAGTTLAAEGETVQQWNDQSGNANNATQATAGARPIFKVNIVNGKQVVRFDGTDDWMSLSTGLGMFRNVAGGTIIAVAKWRSAGTSGTPIVAVSKNVNIVERARIGVDDWAPRKFEIGGLRVDGGTFSQAPGTIQDTAWHLFTGDFQWSNAVAHLYLDGVLDITTDPFQTAGNTSDTDSSRIAIGARTNDSGYGPLDIAEIIICDSALSDPNRQLMDGYLNTEYAIY